MDTNKMREQFEAAFAKKTASKAPDEKTKALEVYGGFESLLLETLVEDRYGDTYRTDVFATAWWAWQASREAVVVDLPDHFRPSRQEIIFAIEAQGLKVAP